MLEPMGMLEPGTVENRPYLYGAYQKNLEMAPVDIRAFDWHSRRMRIRLTKARIAEKLILSGDINGL